MRTEEDDEPYRVISVEAPTLRGVDYKVNEALSFIPEYNLIDIQWGMSSLTIVAHILFKGPEYLKMYQRAQEKKEKENE